MAEHEPSIGLSSDWYTPPEIFDTLGLVFDLDPCSPGPEHWVPARRVYTKADDGLTQPWDEGACRTFWDGVVALGRPIFFTLSAWPRPVVTDYLEQLHRWTRWLQRYPQVAAILTHGFPWRLLRDGRRLRLPHALFEPFRQSTARLELLFQINLGNIWEYPYDEVHTAIAQLVDTIGSDRMMYGTDMPNVERFCNYRQTLDTFRVHCTGLISDGDIANIVGGTAARLFGLKPRS